MKCFYSIAEEALTTSDIELKSQLIEEMKIYCNKIKINRVSKYISKVRYSIIFRYLQNCLSKRLPKRRQIHTKKGL